MTHEALVNDAALKDELRRFLAQHNALTLAYTDEAGVGACGLWFAADDDLACYFLSSPETRHGRALRDGGAVAFAIHKDDQDWRAIRGVQGRGWCSPVPAADAAGPWRVYLQRFPFVAQQFPDLEAALRTAWLWRITPAWLRLIDNTRGFGHKQEIMLASRAGQASG
ncbi:MAG: pyridoxamine 5'-phosphate oxidase family protein [Anaerolineae bacterium]|nr:pyridoxamine 5'-phosphate oxidase family protein [Candidatus Roseilinea sp.]MDW8451275.1 pyridoxamine 5'-phosphate oxidase family protein [Anaerolineae bacterium]